MKVTREAFHGLDCVHVWWPESPESVSPLLAQTPVVVVRHCDDGVAAALKRYAFRTFERFPNLLMNLALSEEEMWRRVKRETRKDINKVRRMGCEVLVNKETDTALQLINGFIGRRKFSLPISGREWERMLSYSDAFIVKHEGQAVAAHVVLVDALRVKALYSATVDRTGREDQRLIGALNKFLNWYEFMYYRERGVHWYDQGGADGDSIQQFKQSFGGEIVEENTLEMAAKPLLRSVLRVMTGAKAIIAPRRALPAIFRVPALQTRTVTPRGNDDR